MSGAANFCSCCFHDAFHDDESVYENRERQESGGQELYILSRKEWEQGRECNKRVLRQGQRALLRGLPCSQRAQAGSCGFAISRRWTPLPRPREVAE
jgi:hypothetical protein